VTVHSGAPVAEAMNITTGCIDYANVEKQCQTHCTATEFSTAMVGMLSLLLLLKLLQNCLN
jgi:hypothetical protein